MRATSDPTARARTSQLSKRERELQRDETAPNASLQAHFTAQHNRPRSYCRLLTAANSNTCFTILSAHIPPIIRLHPHHSRPACNQPQSAIRPPIEIALRQYASSHLIHTTWPPWRRRQRLSAIFLAHTSTRQPRRLQSSLRTHKPCASSLRQALPLPNRARTQYQRWGARPERSMRPLRRKRAFQSSKAMSPKA